MLLVHRSRVLVPSTSLLLSLLTLTFVSLSAQTAPVQHADLSIRVFDPTGAVIPNSEISLEGEKHSVSRTGPAGIATISLPYGNYDVKVSKSGFTTALIKQLPIRAPKPPMLDVVLQIGPSQCSDCFGVDEVPTITTELPTKIEQDLPVLPVGGGPMRLLVDESINPACIADKRAVGACFVVHGRLSNWNGNPTQRIWIVGTKRMLGVREDTDLPKALGDKMGNFEDVAVGDFEICPLTLEHKGRMQIVCVASVSGVNVSRRKLPTN